MINYTKEMKDHAFVHFINQRNYKKVAEVGVAGGVLTTRALSRCKGLVEYHCIDPWKVYIESYHRPPHARERKQSWWDKLHLRLVAVSERNLKARIFREESVIAAKSFAPESLDAVYIDAIHDAENIVNDVRAWLPVLKPGGMISGHDYGKSYTSMSKALDGIFGRDLHIMIINPKKSRMSHRNVKQGGNWWVFPYGRKDKYLEAIQEKYSGLLFEGNEI